MSRGATLIDALQASFRNALRSPEGTADPVALLWSDEDAQWRDLLPLLRAAVPELYVLGPYDATNRTGPAIWLRCVLERRLAEAAPPPGATPILYLPGVGRHHLRAGGDCPSALQPLVELQYRGALWQQRNNRDWSVEAFLASDDGLGLDLATDARTREALLRTLPLVAQAPVDGLRGRRLDAEDFDRLAVSDPVRDVLRFMSDPDAFRAGLDLARWKAFRSVCESVLKVDPEDGAAAAAEALVEGGGAWDRVWERFCEAPRLYRGVAGLLRRTRRPGQGKIAFDRSGALSVPAPPADSLGRGALDEAQARSGDRRYDEHPRRPDTNTSAEDSLRKALEAALAVPHAEACQRVVALEAEHGRRRDWVWAQLGESSLAMALESLSCLAKLALTPIGGATAEAAAADYAREGWTCDRAAMEALASARAPSDVALVADVVRALYAPWLDTSARHFQKVLAERPGILPTATTPPGRDTCTLFVDGLRFDAGCILHEKLEVRGAKVRLVHRLVPLPTVTATAKPIAMPVADLVQGPGVAEDFVPFVRGTDREATAPRLRDAMVAQGVRVLGADETAAPAEESPGWAEVGRFDELGHKLGAELAGRIEAEVDRVADRVLSLLDGGWARVRVVTDHGWLLMPGGLPKIDLPPSVVEAKWARCAAVKGGSSPAVPTWPWHWRPECLVASPPGIGTFRASVEYAHGGVSLQECVVPDLTVERSLRPSRASIASVVWRGMRCRVAVSGSGPGLKVDLRAKPTDPATSLVAEPKTAGADVSLAVADDSREGHAAVVVLVDGAGNVIDRHPTIVGEKKA